MSIQNNYNEWSHTYDSDTNATRDLDRIVTARVLAASRFTYIIEVGCGTGKNTALFSRIGGRVHALDFSEDMLRQAKAKLRHNPNVKCSVADITKRWPCEDQSADLIVCNLVLEHVSDLSPVFAEAARTLKPGGWMFICELHPFRQYQGIVANYNRNGQTASIQAFVHDLSDFLTSAHHSGLLLKTLQEWRHEKDEGKPPRLVSFLFEKVEQGAI